MDIKSLQENYWSKLSERINNYYPDFNSRKPDSNAYYLPLGSTSAHISLKINSQKKIMECKIVISHNKELFDYLESFKEDIESELGFSLNWKRKTGVESHIDINANFDIKNYNDWDRAINWHLSMAIMFKDVFSSKISEFK